ncbi:MAG: hypothetical protein IPI42_10760 [Saprospiraceae bacterium]|nr:hypothetical protein [Candidatus Parvibacillus calidus]
MYFKSVVRINPAGDNWAGYYRLVESYRNANDRCITGRCSTSDLRTSLLIRWWRFKGGLATGLWGDLTFLKVMMR